MAKLTLKLIDQLIKESLSAQLAEDQYSSVFDDGTKDSRGLVKALQHYVLHNLKGPANILVDLSDNWDGHPGYVISQAGQSGAAYKITGEPHTDMRSKVVANPDQLGTKRIVNTTPGKVKAWLSKGTNPPSIGSNLPPSPPLSKVLINKPIKR